MIKKDTAIETKDKEDTEGKLIIEEDTIIEPEYEEEKEEELIIEEDTIIPHKEEKTEEEKVLITKPNIIENKNTLSEKYGTLKHSILAFLILFFVIFLYDIVTFFSELYTTNIVLGLIVSVGVIASFIPSYFYVMKQIKSLRVLKTNKELQLKIAEKRDENKESVREDLLKLLKHYQSIMEVNDSEEIEKYINDRSKYPNQVIKKFEDKILNEIDSRVEEKIIEHSISISLSTTISPYPFVDMLLMIRTNFIMTKDIMLMYGLKPTLITSLKIFKEAIISVLFAGSTEQASELLSDGVAKSKLLSVATGLFNGYRVIKVGLMIQKSIRPIPFESDKSSFKCLKDILGEKLKFWKK